MKLTKPRADIGFATNNAPAALAFWQNEIGDAGLLHVQRPHHAKAGRPPLELHSKGTGDRLPPG